MKMIVLVLIFLLVVVPLIAQQVIVDESSRVAVDYVYNEEDGLTYLWCRQGCARFMEWATLHDLGQGFEDTLAANEAVWAWQDAWEQANPDR